MSDDSTDRDAKTVAPSERRLEQLAVEGQIPLGRDLAAVGAFAAAIAALSFVGPKLMPLLLERVASAAAHPERVPELEGYKPVLAWGTALLALTALGATVPMLAQTRGRVWANLALPDLSRVWKLERVTRVFQREGLVDLGSALLKVTFISAAARWAFADAWAPLLQLLDAPASSLALGWFKALLPAALKLLAAMGAIAALDAAVQRWKFMRDARMTRDEARREHREDEGDPLLKGQRKRKQRELAKHRVAIDVPRADAVVVNPTHVAVALRYRKDEGGAPRVLAKGKGALAEAIRDIARAHGIAIVQDVPLARLLHRRVRVGGFIPKETFKAVATVLAHVYRLKHRAG